MDAIAEPPACRFEDFVLERKGRALYRLNPNGERTAVPLGSRAIEILRLLIDRHGEFVSRREIMAAVWPNAAVEDSNLTVQMAALRRVLDSGRTRESCIQTVPGRGYRLAVPITQLQAKTGLALPPPRLSIVVLPFENLTVDPKDNHLADAITDDLTSDLTLIPDVLVTAREAASAYSGRPIDVRMISEELRVRYLLKGSMRRLGTTLHVNVQLISGETGAVLWSDRFAEKIGEPSGGVDNIVIRLKDEIEIRLIDIESARSLRERPANPDAFDLVLQARSVKSQPPSFQRDDEELNLLERALDPCSAYAMTYIAFHYLSDGGHTHHQNFDDLQRAARLLAQARTIAPNSPMVLNTYVMWLREVRRCAEAIEICQRAIQMNPSRIRSFTNFYHVLALCKTWLGYAAEGIALETEANRLNPLSRWRFNRYRYIGWYSLLLGRDLDAIDNLEQSLAIKTDEDRLTHLQYLWLAAAYTRTGNVERAKQYLAMGDRLWPYDTVRSRAPELLTSQVYVEQFRRFQNALRLTGLRDHADEDADFGVTADAVVHRELAGFTPMDAPGAKTIRTPDLVELLACSEPSVIDTTTYTWGQSIPRAVGLKYSGLGGNFADEAQDRLRCKMRELTNSDLDKPIVAVGWNPERFDGRNLALRLVALGYTQVYWYRGGREAWEVNRLPETNLDLQQW